MLEDSSFTLIDGIVATVLVVAALRGLFIGLIRESFSIASLGAAVVAARYGAEPVGAWLTDFTGGETGPVPPTWIAGAALAVGAAVGVAGVGYFVRRGARIVGLTWVDRLAGSALGAAEGVVVAMLIILGTTFAIGRQHPALSESRSLAAYDALRAYAEQRAPALPDVAAPSPDP